MNDAYMPAPEQEGGQVRRPDAADAHHRHVDQRFSLRTSTAIQATRQAPPRASSPSVFGEPQPQRRRLADREQHDRDADRHQGRREPVDPPGRADRGFGDQAPGGDRGDQRSRPAGSRTASGSRGARRSRRRARSRRRRRRRGSPRAGRCSPATFSRGNSSRTIPNASGKMPPPAPWMKRATISTASELGERRRAACRRRGSPASSSSSRSLPYMSPRRPMIAVPTEADSR